MDYTNERYVRLYTRMTADLLAFGWEGRLVWYELLRNVDRSGVIEYDAEMLPELLRVPPEVFSVGIERLVARGSAVIADDKLVIPNYIEAQEASQSDRQRQRDSRERRRAKLVNPEQSEPRSQNVTDGHAVTSSVTTRHSVPSLAVLNHSPPTPPGVESESAANETQSPPSPPPSVPESVATEHAKLKEHLLYRVPRPRCDGELLPGLMARYTDVATLLQAGETVDGIVETARWASEQVTAGTLPRRYWGPLFFTRWYDTLRAREVPEERQPRPAHRGTPAVATTEAQAWAHARANGGMLPGGWMYTDRTATKIVRERVGGAA